MTPFWVVSVIATLIFLREAKSLLLPIALGVLLSYALEPVVAWLEHRRLPRWAGASLAMLGALAIVIAGAYALRDDLMNVVETAPAALNRLRDLVRRELGYPIGDGEIAPQMQQAAAAIFALSGHVVVVFFLIFFLLLSGHQVRDRFVEVIGRGDGQRHTIAKIVNDISLQVQRYLLVLLFTAGIVALATWTVLAWMGVEHAAMWGLLAGIFNSIPYFGPVIVSGGLFVVGLMQGGGMNDALRMSAAALVITSLEGWLLTPPLMGKVERMSPLTVFLGLLLWTWLWGGWGTILAVPMLAVIKTVADHVQQLKPLGRLMAP